MSFCVCVVCYVCSMIPSSQYEQWCGASLPPLFIHCVVDGGEQRVPVLLGNAKECHSVIS